MIGKVLYKLHLIEYDGFPTLGGFALICLVILAIAGSVIGFAVYAAERTSCEQQLHKMHKQGSYGFWTDCMVQLPDGSQVPLDNYRVAKVEK